MKYIGLLIVFLSSGCTQMDRHPLEYVFYSNETVGSKSSGSFLNCVADWSSDKESGTEHFRFPALFNWDGLVGYSKSKDVSTLDLLLYSHEITGKTTKRDIFPFITWDSGEKESGFSIFGGLFAKHERNGKTGGRVLFIPWGE